VNSAAIYLSQLNHAWTGQPPLFHIDELTVPQGKHLFIQGPSGCGKSTLLSLLAGVQAVQTGVCQVLGRDMAALTAVQRDRLRGEHMGVIFQQFNLLSYLDVQANVLVPTRLFPSRAAASARTWGSPVKQATALAQQLGLVEKMWHQPINQLSVGQQQRVAAVRALMGAPELVIADEPTSALDDARQLEFLDLLLQTAEKQNTSVIMVSHNERLAHRFDQVFAMQAGVVA
jgi:putative ABC transport system ATP-binding protein